MWMDRHRARQEARLKDRVLQAGLDEAACFLERADPLGRPNAWLVRLVAAIELRPVYRIRGEALSRCLSIVFFRKPAITFRGGGVLHADLIGQLSQAHGRNPAGRSTSAGAATHRDG